MRRFFVPWLLCTPALAWCAVASLESRWEGVVEIPARPLRVVVDVARDAAGAWAASIIVPGLVPKGAPVSNVAVEGDTLRFDLGGALAVAPYGPARVELRSKSADALTGELTQAGNVAKLALVRAGPAQVEPPARSTPVSMSIEAEWSGEFELAGYPRRVTITLANHAGAPASATFVVVGKRTTELPVDLVVEEGDTLRVESRANRVSFEGRFAAARDEIRGEIALGGLELPLTLRRSARKTS